MTENATQHVDVPLPDGIDAGTFPELVTPNKALSIRNCHIGSGALIERRAYTRLSRATVTDQVDANFVMSEVDGIMPLGSTFAVATDTGRLYAPGANSTLSEIERNEAPVTGKKALHAGPIAFAYPLSVTESIPDRYRNPNIACTGDWACITWWRRIPGVGGEGTTTNRGYAMVYNLVTGLTLRVDEIAQSVAIGDPTSKGSNPSLIPLAIGGRFFVLWVDVASDQIHYSAIDPAATIVAWSAAANLLSIEVTTDERSSFDATTDGSVGYVTYTSAAGEWSVSRFTQSGLTLSVSHTNNFAGSGIAEATAIAVGAGRVVAMQADASGGVYAAALEPSDVTVATNGARKSIGSVGAALFVQLSCCVYQISDPSADTEIKATLAWCRDIDEDSSGNIDRYDYKTSVACVAVEHLSSHSEPATVVYGMNMCHRPFRRSGLSTTTNAAPSFLGLRRSQDLEDTYYTYIISMDTVGDHAVDPPFTSSLTPVARYSGLTAACPKGTDDDQDVYEQGVCAVIEHGGRFYWVGVEQVPASQDEAVAGVETFDTLHIYSIDFRTDACWNAIQVNGSTLIAGSIPRMISPEVMSGLCFNPARGVEGFVPLHSPPALYSLVSSTTGTGALTSEVSYYYCLTYEYQDVRGRRHFGAPSQPQLVETGVGHNSIALAATFMQAPQAGYYHAKLVYWRTVGDPPDVDNLIFYRLAERTAHFSSAVTDEVADVDLTNNEILYTSSGELENFPPPPSRALCLWKNRIVALDSETGKVWPSKVIIDREWPGFHEGLAVSTDVHTSLPIFLSEDTDNLIVWWSDAIGIIYGEPGSDTGQIGSLTQPRLLPTRGIGLQYVKSLVRTPLGHMFKSARGFYLLGADMSLTYIGREVEAYNGATIVGACISETPLGSQEVRFETQSTDGYEDGWVTLCFDLTRRTWHVHTRGRKPRAAASIGGTVYVATEALSGTDAPWTGGSDVSGVWVEGTDVSLPSGAQSDPSGKYNTILDSAWMTFAGKLGRVRARRMWMHGNIEPSFRDPSITVYYDYNDVSAQGPTSCGAVSSVRRTEVNLSRHECDAIRVLIRDFKRLVAMRFEVEAEKGTNRRNVTVTG